ncbi:serine/threonine-protein kinase [uncultured Paludibaculum sp.]|uniref:serine/threonine-protein kinase n=1 Tax=uncultured Paludibaculum sp. TaxID=1765020 RepID=UPI002AAC3AA1|nr:serine/threonine-protein kinase [uncultured Paludibaculum sp.]
MRAEVQSLLHYETGGIEGLTGLVAGAAGDWLNSVSGPEPDHCGPYRLLRPLGSGGMGVVYLAERTDGEIQQTVAVKLLRHAHRPAWHSRFLRERQLLASLQHPSIVHVVDAGHTEDGRPYLAMEYVEGVPIDAYAASISVESRLKLFLQVCEGVSHAHRHLIIHRDLKPSNILVSPSGATKLLDFGIARLMDETGDVTQTIERLLTPHYASPEQLSGAAQTTATDVYSLGAVLYKLLTGEPPREDSPFGASEELVPASRKNPEVPKDLDFVLRKALRTEPEERYGSVDELASDIRAVLEWRPVQARSGDAWYRTRRFLRRFWVPVTAAVVVLMSLSAGVYVANRERAVAERRFRDVRALARKLFDIDREVAQLPGGSNGRQLIVDTALGYLRRVSADVRMDPELALEVGAAYMRVARVQGVGISTNLGQTGKSDQSEQKAQTLVESVLAAQPRNRAALLLAAQIAHDRMILAGDGHREDEALRFARKSAESLGRYLDSGNTAGPPENMEAQQAIITGINVANRYRLAGRFDEALQLCWRTIDFAHATNWEPQAGATLMIVAMTHRARGDLDEALRAIRESVRILEPAAGEQRNGRLLPFALALVRAGQILGEDEGISLGRAKEAEEYLMRAFRIADEYARRDPKDFLSQYRAFTAETTAADIVRHTDPRRALALYDDGIKRLAGSKDNAGWRRNEAATLAASVYPLIQLGRHAEARRRLDVALEHLAALKLYPAQEIELGSVAMQVVRARAELKAAGGDVRRSAEDYRALLDHVFASHPEPETDLEDAVELSNLYRAAARMQRRAGPVDRAMELEARRLALWQSWSGKSPKNGFVHRQLEAARLR